MSNDDFSPEHTRGIMGTVERSCSLPGWNVMASSDPPQNLPEPVSTRKGWKVRFVSHDSPVSLAAGQVTPVTLHMKNVGDKTWSPAGDNPVHVGYRWLDASGQPLTEVQDHRTALPRVVAPGREIALGATLAAPRKPGSYRLRWDLVAEGITWFAEADGEPLTVPVSVTALPRDVTGWRVQSLLNPTQVAFALNGDPRTYWDSRRLQAPSQWFRLDLSAPRVLDGIQFLSPGKGFPSAYCLRVSADGKLWNEVGRVDAGNTYDVTAIFSPQPAQYVQMDLLAGPATATSWMISEILVHSAAAWTASASHNDSAAGRAIDNRADTAWSSEEPQAPGMWFQIDLGREEIVSGLALLPPAGQDGEPQNPVSFRVATWDSHASRWQVACDKSHNQAPVDVIFTATATQFINIQLLQPAAHPWAIRQVRVIREMDSWLGQGE